MQKIVVYLHAESCSVIKESEVRPPVTASVYFRSLPRVKKALHRNTNPASSQSCGKQTAYVMKVKVDCGLDLNERRRQEEKCFAITMLLMHVLRYA